MYHCVVEEIREAEVEIILILLLCTRENIWVLRHPLPYAHHCNLHIICQLVFYEKLSDFKLLIPFECRSVFGHTYHLLIYVVLHEFAKLLFSESLDE